MNGGLIRPMNDLVKKYGKGIQESQLITIDGKVMAVAFMANAQHLYIRTDVLKQHGISTPNTYDCLLYTSPSPRDLSTSRMPSSA